MHLKLFSTFFLICVVLCIQAQSLTGKVINTANQEPLSGVSVFISNTSKGTITDANGVFTITNFPTGKYDVVFSSIGYQTEVVTIASNQLSNNILVALTANSKLLDEVIVRQYEKNGWEKWGKFFLENFIGTAASAAQTVILNKEVIGFVHNRKQNIIQAYASEPLIIENNYLGYTLVYELKEFEFNFITRIFYYQGYPLFQEKKAKNQRIAKRWQQHRQEVYEGSLMHFMRCFYRNKLLDNGFETRKLIKQPNVEKQRVKALMQQRLQQGNKVNITFGAGDSSEYYQQILQQPNDMAMLVNTIYPADSFAYVIDSTTALLEFEQYLHITYLRKKPPTAYYASKGIFNKVPEENTLISQVTLPNKRGVQVYANGSFFNGRDFLTSDYWAWSEKLCNMLPFDYKPPRESKLL